MDSTKNSTENIVSVCGVDFIETNPRMLGRHRRRLDVLNGDLRIVERAENPRRGTYYQVSRKEFACNRPLQDFDTMRKAVNFIKREMAEQGQAIPFTKK